jgi:hypothetical protein
MCSVLDTDCSVCISFQASGYQALSVLPAGVAEAAAAGAESASVAPGTAAAAPATKRTLYFTKQKHVLGSCQEPSLKWHKLRILLAKMA